MLLDMFSVSILSYATIARNVQTANLPHSSRVADPPSCRSTSLIPPTTLCFSASWHPIQSTHVFSVYRGQPLGRILQAYQKHNHVTCRHRPFSCRRIKPSLNRNPAVGRTSVIPIPTDRNSNRKHFCRCFSGRNIGSRHMHPESRQNPESAHHR